ncbi:MAG: NADPH-dependent 7-cyano-7-deazaguanine reductase QueF [Pseudomonadota bacterium]|jgi:7-cyano-7-deazaguanine reductase
MSNPLGKTVSYSEVFNPGVLFPIERAQARVRLGFKGELPFLGVDRWTCYELSWLDLRGVPQVAIATIEYPASSPRIVESKSLKLFLGSLNFTKFPDVNAVQEAIRQPLLELIGSEHVAVSLLHPDQWGQAQLCRPPGESIDSLDSNREGSTQLKAGTEAVEETLHSNLLRSLCPVTSQPDWGTLVLRYRGHKLDRASLMTYLIAHRSYQGFHEECCERIFSDVVAAACPSSLWVGCFYTRRGGLDINPERWMPGSERAIINGRLARQ